MAENFNQKNRFWKRVVKVERGRLRGCCQMKVGGEIVLEYF